MKHILEQQIRVAQVQELIELLVVHATKLDGPLYVAVRALSDIHMALDTVTLERVLRDAPETAADEEPRAA